MATMKTLNGYGFNATELNGKNSDSYLQLGNDETGSTGEAPTINAGTFGGMTVGQFVDMIYPVGSIYMSANATSPETLFGGTWESIGGRFLLGADATYAAGSTGGAATVSITPAGTNGGTAITAAQMPKHRHQVRIWDDAGTKGTAKTVNNYGAGVVNVKNGAQLRDGYLIWKTASFQAAQDGYGDQSGITDIAGNDEPHTHAFKGTTQSIATMPPYLAVYMWKRTA